MQVISLFDYTGNMLRPWAEAGFECHAVDIQHCDGFADGVYRHKIDLLNRPQELYLRFPEGSIAFVAAFPPCTHLAVSGARWFKGKGLRDLHDSIAMFATAAEFCEWSGAPYLIENPVSTISTYWRKPDCTFHPHEYAGLEPSDNYTKKTCLWTGGGFVMPRKRPGQSTPDDRIHKCPPGPERANIRSATPMGFARAVYESNRPLSSAEEKAVEIVAGMNAGHDPAETPGAFANG